MKLSIETSLHKINKESIKSQSASDKNLSKIDEKKDLLYSRINKKGMIYELNERTITKKFDELYEKRRKLGEGAHTTVYQYLEKNSDEIFAVKIWKNPADDIVKDIKDSFLLLKQLDHPYLLKARELYIQQSSSKCYMVT